MRERTKFRGKLSYANVMATVAVFIALGGASYAAIKVPKNSIGRSQIKRNAVNGSKVANRSLTGSDIDTSTVGQVPSAKHADSADKASSADNATNANTVGGISAGQLQSHAFNVNAGTAFLPAGAHTTTAATLELPAGTYLILGHGEIDNNGDASNNEVKCSLIGEETTARLSAGPALGAQDSVGERTVGSAQLAHTFVTAGQARIDCVTVAGWGSGNVFDSTISAISVQP
jgi:hypothetical protein